MSKKQIRFHAHTCENCGTIFQAAGGYPWKKQTLAGKFRYYCSEECKLGMNYKYMAESALFTARYWYSEYNKHMMESFRWTSISDDGRFCWLGDRTSYYEKAQDDMFNCQEALIFFREYKERAEWQKEHLNKEVEVTP